MNKHITILFLLSFAFTVLSAPVVTPKAHKTQGRCKAGGALKRSPSVSSASSKSHAHPSLHKRAPEFNDTSVAHLYRRASSDIKLCDINFRGSSASNCAGSMGFINGVWYDAGKFPTDPRPECDHILELQLIKAALVDAGFCKAWEGLEKQWSTKDHTAKDKMKEMFIQGLKLTSNPPSEMMWVDKAFNGEKRAFIAAKIKTPTAGTASASIEGYFSTAVRTKAASIATEVDTEAGALLQRVIAAATPHGYKCDPDNPTDDDDYVDALDVAEASFAARSKPVSSLWEKIVATIPMKIVK